MRILRIPPVVCVLVKEDTTPQWKDSGVGAGSPVIATWVSPWEAATRTSVLKQAVQLTGGSEASLPVEVMVMALK